MNKKTILGTVGVIVLGALGSALWEFSKPMLSWLVAMIAEVSTLGIDSLRDAFYSKAARTLGRPIGLALSTTMIVSFIALTAGMICRILSYSENERQSRMGKAMARVFLLSFVVFTIQLVGLAYSMQLASEYQILEVQASPYLSDTELKTVRAKFSQVTSKSDYDNVIKTLVSELQSAGQQAAPNSSELK